MSVQDSRRAQRVNAGEIFGYHCYICLVPTAATIEHVHPRSNGGRSGFDNIRLACPWCNTKKGTKPLDQFLAEGGHLIMPPELPASVEEMLTQLFAWDGAQTTIATGSTNAMLLLQQLEEVAPGDRRKVACVFRTSRHEPWRNVVLGTCDDNTAVSAAWNFLVRHFAARR